MCRIIRMQPNPGTIPQNSIHVLAITSTINNIDINNINTILTVARVKFGGSDHTCQPYRIEPPDPTNSISRPLAERTLSAIAPLGCDI